MRFIFAEASGLIVDTRVRIPDSLTSPSASAIMPGTYHPAQLVHRGTHHPSSHRYNVPPFDLGGPPQRSSRMLLLQCDCSSTRAHTLFSLSL